MKPQRTPKASAKDRDRWTTASTTSNKKTKQNKNEYPFTGSLPILKRGFPATTPPLPAAFKYRKKNLLECTRAAKESSKNPGRCGSRVVTVPFPIPQVDPGHVGTGRVARIVRRDRVARTAVGPCRRYVVSETERCVLLLLLLLLLLLQAQAAAAWCDGC